MAIFRRVPRHHSCICPRTIADTLPLQLCPVQRLPTLASWPLFHLVFLCLFSPLSLPMKQSRNRHWQIRTKTYTTPKKKKGFVLTVRSKFICCRFAFAEPLDWFDEVVQRSLANHMQQKKKYVFFQPIRNKNTFVLSVFPRLILVASFSHLASIVYSLRLAPATGFPAFGPDSMFPAFATDCLFPAFGTDCMISCVWYRLHDFPRMAPIVCFPRLAPVA